MEIREAIAVAEVLMAGRARTIAAESSLQPQSEQTQDE